MEFKVVMKKVEVGSSGVKVVSMMRLPMMMCCQNTGS